MEALVSVLIGYRFKGCWNSTDGLHFVSTSQGNISKSQMFMTDCIICFSSRVHPSWLQQANVFPPKASQTQCISSWWMHCVKTQLYDDISLLCVLSQPNTLTSLLDFSSCCMTKSNDYVTVISSTLGPVGTSAWAFQFCTPVVLFLVSGVPFTLEI